ncbi:MAG: type II toxin-antitoxin system Phd/YefM family antitoxin [Planctomycetes bacterium]|nr:type II toxin-antitoxin system Phd/YefM family antitoxin [Planctomycetota bacterium]
MKTIAVGQFKARCLGLLEEVRRKRERITITKRGVPIAEVVPVRPAEKDLRAWLRGSILQEGDIVSPIGVKWKAAR